MGDLATDRLREIERLREISSRKDDEIAKLLREIERLRIALRRIARAEGKEIAIARAALEITVKK